MKKTMIMFVFLFFITGNVGAMPLQAGSNNFFGPSFSFHKTQYMANNDAEIQYWKNRLQQAEYDLRNAERDYEWAVNNNTGVASAAQRVRICRQNVTICKQHLRSLGYYA